MNSTQNRPNHKGLLLSVMAMTSLILIAGFILFGGWTKVSANTSDISSARTKYTNFANSRLDTCSFCHTSSIPSLNPYGAAYKAAGRSFAAFGSIESADSDGDGFTNLQEIAALTFPGDSGDKPVVASPTAAPTSTPTRTPTATSTSIPPSSTPLPTNTALPTNTPLPTSTGLPTATVLPTSTGLPTSTLQPSATATQPGTPTLTGTPGTSPTPKMTRTPKPTHMRTPRPTRTIQCKPDDDHDGSDGRGGKGDDDRRIPCKPDRGGDNTDGHGSDREYDDDIYEGHH